MYMFMCLVPRVFYYEAHLNMLHGKCATQKTIIIIYYERNGRHVYGVIMACLGTLFYLFIDIEVYLSEYCNIF
jgi:hypothetical protein